jgi:amino acid transporter
MTAKATAHKLNLAEIVAIGIGGMVGGGIFATLGLAIVTAGHAVAIALCIGGILALLTGYSFAHLGLAFHDDGGSFTYIEHAFDNAAIAAIAGIAGWLLVVGYVGTLALYASTFGAFGAALIHGHGGSPWLAQGLGILVLSAFLAVNLTGAKTSGLVELVIVGIKLAILVLFAAVGIFTIEAGRLLPVFNQGLVAPIAASAVIFVAYEGFELIPNTIKEMDNPRTNLKRGLLLSISITMAIYIAVGFVAAGNLTVAEVVRDKEYVLAVAARPSFGEIGFKFIGIAALLSTASAINATLFGSARLAMTMATEHALPKVFSMHERVRPVPWVALVVLTALTAAFMLLTDLMIIATFASATFLVIFSAVNFSAFRLRAKIGINAITPVLGAAMSAGSLVVLLWYTWNSARVSLAWIVAVYAAAIVLEILLILRRGLRRR